MAIWSFRRKRDNIMGKVTKYKARICVHGGMQYKGINYWETYAPVVQWMSVRIMLTQVAIEHLNTKSIDFVLAYPQANLDMDIYMKLLQGFNVGPESGRYVLKLQKNLYGLKQAGHNWFKKISGALGTLSINPRKVDPCVFIGEDVIVLVYVDNCLIFSRDKDKINQLIEKLKNKEKLDLTDEGDVEKYLGVEIDLNKEDKSITFKQTFLIQRAIELAGLSDSNQVDIPAVKPSLSKDHEVASRTSSSAY